MALLAGSCSVSKFIPDGQYLLDAVRIESDSKEIKPADMNVYVRQTPNARWFSLFKLPMYIYCASGRDSTRWMNRFLRRIGDAPHIYDPSLAEETRAQIQLAVQNRGYMGAYVDLKEERKRNKLKTVFRIHTGSPYIVDHLAYDIPDLKIHDYLEQDSVHTLLHPGMRLDINRLDDERGRITSRLQNVGYYRFNKDFITYQADTMLNMHQVQLTMNVLPYQRKKEDTPEAHRQYTLKSVNYVLDTDLPESLSVGGLDSTQIGDSIRMYYHHKSFLRPKVLAYYTHLRPGKLYSGSDVQRTYADLGRLGIVKFSNIRFKESFRNDSAYLDAFVTLAKNKNQALAFEVEGTNSAGDFGTALSTEYTHRNLFRGSESFSLKLRGAYEAVTGLEGYSNSNYMEYAVESSLSFPEFKFPFLSSAFKRRIRATSEVSAKYNWQIRPEFKRTVASAAWSYRWSKHNQKANHRFDLLDVNYIYMPYRSETFKEYLRQMEEVNPLLRYSYENLLIVRLGYTYTYNSSGAIAMKTSRHNSYSIRFNIEESGNLLYAFSKLANKHPKNGEAFQLAKINYAQYIKTDFDYAKNVMIDSRNAMVFHIGVGTAYPYGNSKSLPFEKLYFSGGANSVRGWSVRSLGPGGYKGMSNSLDYVNHTGDLKLDMNIEYRTHLFWKLNGAAFVDAGNIWTLRHRENQPEGQFRFDRFYKQIAVAYGLGIRFDLDFLILRFDGGMKAINPMFTGKSQFPIISPKLSRDFAFHFAVGYPF